MKGGINMYASINLEGRVVNDPEVKTGSGDRKFVTFRLVVNQKFGEQENASFYNCTGGEAMANRITKAGIVKGRMIHISGNQTIREYTDRDGNPRTSVDVGILDWHYVGSKPKGDEQTGADSNAAASAATRQQPGKVNPEQTIGDEDELPL